MFLTVFLFFFLTEKGKLQQKYPNFIKVPKYLWTISNPDIKRIKTQTDITKPKLHQYPLKPEAMQSLKPTGEDLIVQGESFPILIPVTR